MASQNQRQKKPRGKGRPFEKGNTIGHRFEPGNNANPGGRPKMRPEVKAMLLEATEEAAKQQVAALQATKVVVTVDKITGQGFAEEAPDWTTRLKAADGILDRMHGKAAQEVMAETTVTVSDERAKSLEERLANILSRRGLKAPEE